MSEDMNINVCVGENLTVSFHSKIKTAEGRDAEKKLSAEFENCSC